MTKKEAISLLKLAKAEIEWEYPLDYQLALDMAIEALKQESILDKIRVEIMSKDGLEEALEIIDKYKESEGMYE